MNRPTVVNPTDILKNSRLSLHTDTCQAFVGKKKVNLTITEFNLLACFLKNAGKTLSRDDLLDPSQG
jgi:DNA-binding response OmpR family regulator